MNAASLTFGRYVSFDTYMHRLDPRTKIVSLILLLVMIFMPFSVWSTALIMSGLYLVLFFIIMITSKVSVINLFKSLAGMWFLILFLFVIYIFIPNSTYTHVWHDFGNGFILYYDSLFMAGYIILRLLLMISITMVLTSTTKPFDLTYGLEWLMTPLKLIKFPTHIVAMMTSIALRFIPTILDETTRIMKAQESRGVDFKKGSILKRFKAIISLIIPLFVSAFERSEELANAMEARGYDPNEKRTRYRVLRFHISDLIAFLLVTGFVTFIIVISSMYRNLDIIKLFFGVNIGW